MDGLLEEHEKLCQRDNLSNSLEDIQKAIDILTKAQKSIAENPKSASITLAKLQNPVKQAFDGLNNDLKEVYKGLGNYSKALDKKFKLKSLPATDYDALSTRSSLINRAIGMHLLREGQFLVASAFFSEAFSKPLRTDPSLVEPFSDEVRERGKESMSLTSEVLQTEFSRMYYILDEMRNNRNLLPATDWAHANRSILEARGSNLEFELRRLQYIWLLTGGSGGSKSPTMEECLKALAYAKQELATLHSKYIKEIQQLIGAMAFSLNLRDSPYYRRFTNDDAWEDLATSFTREFCSLLGLSADSPLYIASTAGAIALPTLLKLQTIMKEKRTEWTTQHELPVEILLPPAYQFHSIFVCPVSKEQTTDQNPPMMMPCGHVIAQESLSRLSKGGRFKCPYCPGESHPKDARKVFL